MRKIDYHELVALCGQDATRPHLMRPWTGERDGQRRLYATDGRLLVEAHPDDLADPVDWDLFPADEGPRYDAIGLLQARLDAITLDRPAHGIDHPDLPEIATISQACNGCGGAGAINCGCPHCEAGAHDCPVCAGAGRTVTYEPQAIPVHGHWLHSALLERVRPLPRLLLCDARDGHLGLPFVWGEMGRGFIMPMRETADLSKAIARVRTVKMEGRAAA